MNHEFSIDGLFNFLNAGVSAFHSTAAAAAILEENGYQNCPESAAWQLAPGGKYYTTRNGSAIMAWRMPKGPLTGWHAAASHSDSPTWRVKKLDCAEDKVFAKAETEGYGGMIMPSWLDRPLSVAGRVLVRRENGLDMRLVDMKKDMALIPRVAIHLNRDGNNGTKYNPAQDLVALYAGGEQKGSFDREIAAAAGCQPEDIVARDLFLYNNQPGTVWGPAGEFLSAPRLDDLACVFACTQGFLTAHETTAIPVLCVFDNEEIGSETKQGAASAFLPETLTAITTALGLTSGDYRRLVANSFLLSCDNGHARHPNHPELADANEAPVLNGGVVVKHSPRYATDAVSAAAFQEICRRAQVPTQHYANRPDQAGGATLGNIANTKLPVNTVDIGMAQLAMHSCFETMGSRDVAHFVRAVTACYEAALTFTDTQVTLG